LVDSQAEVPLVALAGRFSHHLADLGLSLLGHDDREQKGFDGLDRVIRGIGGVGLAAVCLRPRHDQLGAGLVLGSDCASNAS
jgi:hypothetical protein